MEYVEPEREIQDRCTYWQAVIQTTHFGEKWQSKLNRRTVKYMDVKECEGIQTTTVHLVLSRLLLIVEEKRNIEHSEEE